MSTDFGTQNNNDIHEKSYETSMRTHYSTGDFSDISMLQLADSFFPAGMYTMSNGLESFFYQKRKRTSEEIKELIKVHLEQVIAPADCTALGNAYDAASEKNLRRIMDIDNFLYAMKLIKETRDATIRSGKQVLRCLSYFLDDSLVDKYNRFVLEKKAYGVYPVSLAISANSFGISKQKAGVMMLYGYVVSMVGAALRLGMIQHFDGQKIIHELKPVVTAAVDKFIERPLEGMWQFAPHLDIIQVDHERMDSKMFIS